MTMVEGTINSLPFRAALEPNGKGSHGLRVNKAMHDAAGTDAGDTVTVEITRAGEEPEIRVPADLRQALAAAPPAQASWADITPLARRDWIFSISTARQPETRRRRIEKACDMLASGKRRLCCFPGIKWLMKKTQNHAECGFHCRTQKTIFPRDRQSELGSGQFMTHLPFQSGLQLANHPPQLLLVPRSTTRLAVSLHPSPFAPYFPPPAL
jgi:hypothetical protein